MTDLAFDVRAARRRAFQRVWLLRIQMVLILGLFGAGFVGLGLLVAEQLDWLTHNREDLFAIVITPLAYIWSVQQIERERLLSCTAVARMLRARSVSAPASTDAGLALRNVAEEVAIAAGVPVPRLYIVPDQPGINALAIGPDPARGGVFVTSSAAEELSRDALQAVVAHEFAHLITRDAALHAASGGASAALRASLNPIRAVGRGLGALLPKLSGPLGDGSRLSYSVILAIWCLVTGPAVLGLIHVVMATSGPLVMLGDLLRASLTFLIGMTVLGGLGWILAWSTDLAVSKESEFGADALAVELTRHPDALAEALRAIRDNGVGGLLLSPATTRLRPFFFARADTELTEHGGGSHPSPEKRLRVLKTRTADRPWRAPDRKRSLDRPTLTRATPDPVGDAARLLDALPFTLCDAAHDPALAQPLVYALLLSEDSSRAYRQRSKVPFQDDESTKAYSTALHGQPTAVRLALLEIAMPTLRQMGSTVRSRLLERAEVIAAADGRTTVRETAICEVLHHALAPHRPRRRPTASRALGAGSVLLSALAYSGDPTQAGVQRAFDAGHEVLRESLGGIAPPLARPDRPRLRAALGILAAADDVQQDAVLDAARVTVWSDGRALDGEADLVRAIALVMGRPSSLVSGPADRVTAPIQHLAHS